MPKKIVIFAFHVEVSFLDIFCDIELILNEINIIVYENK